MCVCVFCESHPSTDRQSLFLFMNFMTVVEENTVSQLGGGFQEQISPGIALTAPQSINDKYTHQYIFKYISSVFNLSLK